MPNDFFENDLFDSTDELVGSIAASTRNTGSDGAPVTCLGKTFSNDEDRRAHFREELRQRLVYLKKLEGFPIGEDEDILKLSDPPYFTVCPNPWLKEFVAQWEAEKTELEAKGKRKANQMVPEPYASDVSEGKTNPIYNAHSYHTKVPHPAIMRYILHYTQPGDIVLDGFAGTGMTGIAAQLCGAPSAELKHQIEIEFVASGLESPNWGARRAICSDLSPIASLIAYNYNAQVDVNAFEKDARSILSKVEKECAWMYQTTHVDPTSGKSSGQTGRVNYTVWSDVFSCANCGKEIVFWEAAVDKEAGEVLDEFRCSHCQAQQTKRNMTRAMVTVFDRALNVPLRQAKTVPVLINYTAGGKRYEKVPDATDLKLIEEIEKQEISSWFPTDPLPEGVNTRQPMESHKFTHVHHFYTRRNLMCLSKYWALSQDLNRKVSFGFTAANRYLSKMSKIGLNYYFHGGGGAINAGLLGTLYVPALSVENSVLETFETRNRKLANILSELRSCKMGYTLLQTSSASTIEVESDSVDYIFTDPPFGANIMYSELSYIWESWLKVKTNNKLEAIENRVQGKSLLDYQELMLRCFREYFRVLKPGRWMTVEFSNTGAAVWNGIQTSLQRAGFVIANVAALDKQQGSFKAVTTPTAVKQDLVISCYKPGHEFDQRFRIQGAEISVWDFVNEHLSHLPISILKQNNTTSVIERSPKILFDRLVSFYLMRNMPVPIDATDFQLGLKTKFREADGMVFTAEQQVLYEEQKRKLGITKQLSLQLDAIFNEADGIEWLKDRLYKAPEKRQDLYTDFRKANASTRKGEIPLELTTLLEENFIEEVDGSWRVPDHNEAKDREILRMKALLKEFATYQAACSVPKPKKLKDVRLEALRAGFKSLWEKKEFATLVRIADLIPQNLLLEDEMLLTYYDIAKDRV